MTPKALLTAAVVALCSVTLALAGPAPSQGNNELISAINAAMGELVLQNPDPINAIRAKYYPSSLVSGYQPSCSNGGGAGTYPTPTAGGALANVISTGILKIGRQYPNAPDNWNNGTTDLGLEFELAQLVVSRLSNAYSKAISIQWINDSPANLINLVKTSDNIDIILASISTSMSRLGMIYSCSYAVARRGYIIKDTAGSLFNTITSENELNVAGLKVAAVAGTLSLAWAQQTLTSVDLTIAPSNPIMYELLANDTVQAIVRFEPWNSFWVANQTNSASYKTGVSSTNELLFSAWHTRYDSCPSSTTRAIGLGNQELVDAINIALNNIRVTNLGAFTSAYVRHNATTPSHTFTCAATSSNITNWPIPTAGGSLAQVINSGILRAGRFFPNAPFNYLNGISQILVGVDADIAYEVARSLSAAYSKVITIQWVDVSSADLFNTATNLYNDNVDFMIAGAGPNFGRSSSYQFACSVTSAAFSYVVNRKSQALFDTITDVQQLNNSQYTIAAIVGALPVGFAQRNLAAATLLQVATAADLYQVLSNNSVHAILRQDPNNQYWINQQPAGLYKSGNYGQPFPMSWYIRREKCNAVLPQSPTAATAPVQSTTPRMSSAISLNLNAFFLAFIASIVSCFSILA